MEHFNVAVEYFSRAHEPKSSIKPNSFTYSFPEKLAVRFLPEGAACEGARLQSFF
jgi:hypothetical protein